MEGRFWFASSYAEAAGRFLIACDDLRDAGHSVVSQRLEIGMKGPADEPLCIDVAIVGSLDSQGATFNKWSSWGRGVSRKRHTTGCNE